MKNPVLALVVIAVAGEVRPQCVGDLLAIVGVHAREPLVRPRADLRFLVADEGLPARRPMDLVGDQIPIPESVVGALHRERIAFFAFVEVFDGALVREVRPDPRQRDRKVDRFRDVVVRTQPEGFDDVGAVGSRGDHDHRNLGRRMRFPNAAQHVETAHAGHFDIEQHEVERFRRDARHRVCAAGGHDDVVAFQAEAPREHVAIGLVVVDDEQRGAWRHRPWLASSVSIFSRSRGNCTGFVSKSSPPAANA